MPLSRYLDKFIILGNSALDKQLGADTNGNIYTHESKLSRETWAIEVAGDDGRVCLRSDHGKLLTSTAQGTLGSATGRTEAEQWRVERAPGGGVFVRSVLHGRLLSVLPNGTPTTTTNTSAAEVWRVEEMAPALKLDGTAAHVVLPPMNPDFSQGFTVEAWVRHEAHAHWSRVLDMGNGPGSDNIVLANTSGTPDLSFHVYRGDQVKSITAAGALTLNTWTHVAATVDAAGHGRLYKNGVLVAQGALWLPNNIQRARNYVGKSNWADAYLRGLVADVRLWTYARSGEQIQGAMARRLHGDEAGLCGYWPLDAAAGLTARDESGNGRHGAVVGEASWVAPRLTGLTFAAPGEEIKVSAFAGNSRVRLPAMTLDFSAGCTVEAWVRPQAPTAWSRVFEMHTTYGGDHVMLLANGDGTGFGMYAVAADNVDKGLYVAGTLPAGKWTHICGVLDPAGQVRLYANGKLVGSGPAQVPKAAARPNCMIGNSPEGSPFAGLIAEVRLWTGVRSEAQIQAAMGRGLTGHERGLAGYWKLDEDSGASARDQSPHGRDGAREGGCVQVTSLLPIEAKRSHVTTVTHEGKVLVFATRPDGRVQYTVKQSGFEDTVAMTSDARPGWEPWRDLELPTQADDTSVTAREARTLTFDTDTSKYVLCSRYHTAADTAVAPVQVVSGFGFLYVFRQSTAGTLLVDRFVLDGMTNQLVPKVEVRFKRSRKRHEPLLPASGAAEQTFDSLDFSDTAGVPFYEPSTELKLVAGVHDGLFAVVLLPTRDVDRQRWHFFVHTTGSKVEAVSLLSSETGLFDPQQRTSSADGSLLPGVERTVIDLGAALQGPVRSLSAVRYDLQEEQATASGARMLLRTAVRVMLVAAGSQGAPVLSFAAAADGTLSRLADQPTDKRVLHSERRELLLPLDTLENVVAAQVDPPITGAITALRRGNGDKVAVQTSGADALKIGDSVEIRGTRNYNGRYLVKATASDTFEIEVEFAGLEDGIGRWEKVVTRETGLTFDGAVTSYRRTPEGKLIVTAPNHGLVVGDAVQITGTAEYNSIYPVSPIDAGQFALAVPWALGSAIGVKRLASLKRRGVDLDGVGEYIAVREAKVPTGAASYTVEAWIRPRSMTAGGIVAWGEHGADNRVTSLRLTPTGLRHEWGGQDLARDTAPLQGGWHHVAASYDAVSNTRRLYLDGALIASDQPAGIHDVPAPVANFTIGRARGDHFAGSIADVRVWSVARTDAQIAGGMFEPINGQEEGLCGCWKLGALAEVDHTPWALAFDGVDDCLRVPDSAALRVQKYTVEVWIKPERPTQEWVGLVGKPGRNFNIWLHRDGFIHHRYHTNTGTSEGPPDTPRGTIRWGEWNHIAITNDGQTARTFHDGIERASGSLAGKTLIADSTPLIVGRSLDDRSVEYFTGLLTELRLWSRARTAQEIAADRGRSLAGHEAELVAYWRGSEGAGAGLVDLTARRLDAVTAGGVRAVASDAPVRASAPLRVQRAYDFSPSRSDGVAVGAPYVANVQIQRAENAQYRNDDLVAVVRGGVYEESVELRPIGGTLTGLKFSQWFKKSRESTVPDATLPAIPAELTDIGGGWVRASCPFAVPAETSLMRAFKLVDLVGSCTAIELRRHRLVELPAAITEWEYAVAPTLAPTSALATDLGVKLAALADSERGEAALLVEKRVLEDKLASIGDPTLAARIAAVQADVTALEAEHTRLTQVRAQHERMPMFSYCRYMPRHSGMALAIDGASHSTGADLIQVSYRGTDNELFYADPGLPAGQVAVPSINDWFLLRPGHNNGMVVDVEGPSHDNGARLHQWIVTGGDNQRFRFEPVAGVANAYVLRVKHSGKVLDVYDGSGDHGEAIIQYDSNGDANQQFVLQVVRDSPITSASRAALDDCNRRLTARRAELEQLRASQAASTAQRTAWQARLTAIDGTELPAVRAAIDSVNSQTLAALIADQAHAPRLTELRKEPRRGLATLGALLGFVRPPGRMTATQTCDGDVQLSYLDVRGRMRELRYQATRDGKGASFDCWRPTLARAGLNFRSGGDMVRLDRPVALGDDWTVEAWFQHPLPRTGYCNTLFGVIGECEILVKDNMLGMWLRGIVDCGFDLTRLATGWHHLAVVASGSGETSTTAFYIDGQRVGDLRSVAQMRAGSQARLDEIKATVYKAPITVVTIGNHGGGGKQFGRVAEVRLWSLALKDDEIAANSRTLLTGREPGLAAYYPMTEAQGVELRDASGRGNHGKITGAPWVALDAPIGRQAGELRGEAMVVAEYDTIGQRPGGTAMMALMRRAFAVETARGVRLHAEQRVEELDLRWVGNAQFQPTLLGYIEGAPPVPSENLTMSASYDGAAAVELSTDDDVSFQWSRTKDDKFGSTTELFLGIEAENMMLIGLPIGVSTITELSKVRLGLKGSVGGATGSARASTIGAQSSLKMTDRLELRGTLEDPPRFPQLGNRFIPKNVGYALTVSGLADVFVTSLRGSGRMVGYEVVPNADIPPDVNTVSFLINPAYTMAGSLDGMTGSAPTSDRFFAHVPELRAQYGSRYPASYYRLQEAYDLKQQIAEQDKRREAYFFNFDASLKSLGPIGDDNLAREIDKGDAPGAVTVNRQEDRPPAGGAATPAVDAEVTAITEDQGEYEGRAAERRAQLEKSFADREQLYTATRGLDAWQRRMEDLRIRAGKRNIVNTYVWDANGGLHTEQQQFANSVQHSVGSSASVNFDLGNDIKVYVGIGGVELSSMFNMQMSQTLTKTVSTSRGFGLGVSLAGVESRGVTDHKDRPLVPGEKVGRYRFMSFYLEGATQHFDDFFAYVVDPEWLSGNSENARALRDTRGRTNKTWRVLHRVTYVERPALANFGADLRPLPAAPAAPTVDKRVESLEQKVDLMLELLQALQTP